MLLSLSHALLPLSLLLGQPGQAVEEAEVRWRKTFSQAADDAKTREVPLFVFFYADDSKASKKFALMARDDALVKILNKSVVPVRLDAYTEDALVEKYKVELLPALLVVKHDGELVGRLKNDLGVDAFIEELKRLLKKAGKTVLAPEEVATALQRGDEALTNKAYGDAVAHYRTVVDSADRPEDVKAAQAGIDKIENLAKEAYEPIDTLIDEKEYRKAAIRLRPFLQLFAGTAAARKAEQVERDVVNPGLGKRDEKAAAFAVEMKAVNELVKKRQYSEALKKLEDMAERYDDIPQGKEAAAKLERLKKDPLVVEKIADAAAEKDCVKWLRTARNMKRNDKLEKAKEYYNRIIEKHPLSSYARTAEAEMKGL